MTLAPDIAILAECAEPAILRSKSKLLNCTSIEWIGHNRQKGLAVLSFGNYVLAKATRWDESLRHFLPVHITGPVTVNLLAAWVFGPSERPAAVPNSTSLMKAVTYYAGFLAAPWAVMAGDFNAGVVFDRMERPMFRSFVGHLDSLGLQSVLHGRLGWDFGAESQPTFYDRSRQDASFHIDYVFSNRQAAWVDVGAKSDWRALSDHMPLVVDWHIAHGLPNIRLQPTKASEILSRRG